MLLDMQEQCGYSNIEGYQQQQEGWEIDAVWDSDSENIEGEDDENSSNNLNSPTATNPVVSSPVITKRLWNYILRDRLNMDPEFKWSRIAPAQITAIAKEMTKSTFKVEGKTNTYYLNFRSVTKSLAK